MNIIFLDIDGVLNSDNYYRMVDRSLKDWSRFDPSAIILIKKLIVEFELKIVISSTWRFGVVKLLNDELKKSDLIQYLHKDWKTPQIHPSHRGQEIKLWLDNHPEVKHYLIFDDDENILHEQKPKFIKTGLFEGMIEEHYYQARKILIQSQ